MPPNSSICSFHLHPVLAFGSMHTYFQAIHAYIQTKKNIVFTTKTQTLAGPELYWHPNLHPTFPNQYCGVIVMGHILYCPNLMVQHYFIFFAFIKQTESQKRPHSLNFQFPMYLSTSIVMVGDLCSMDRDSVVTKATHYTLDSLGIKSQLGHGFPHSFRLSMGPSQPLSQWLPGHSQG